MGRAELTSWHVGVGENNGVACVMIYHISPLFHHHTLQITALHDRIVYPIISYIRIAANHSYDWKRVLRRIDE
jgi:hypothetical protein